NITPKRIVKSQHQPILGSSLVDAKGKLVKVYTGPEEFNIAADPVVQYLSKDELQKLITKTRKSMEAAARELNFIEAARLRDELKALEEMLKEK
ncbi:MAG: UvrB/UvrC motif-containing protein, partial [Bacteroidia bacterium]|nr:UvrB/UvrC motif-containing protein [Bacteroidia bacterium]